MGVQLVLPSLILSIAHARIYRFLLFIYRIKPFVCYLFTKSTRLFLICLLPTPGFTGFCYLFTESNRLFVICSPNQPVCLLFVYCRSQDLQVFVIYLPNQTV